MLYLLLNLSLSEPVPVNVDVSGGASAEIRGGWAPPDLSSPSTAAFLAILTPSVDLRVEHRGRGALNLGYAPRLQMRLPNRLDVRRPIILNQAYLHYYLAPSSRVEVDAVASGSVGEIDYSSVGVALGPGQGLPEDFAITTYGVATAEVRFAVVPAVRHALAVYPFGSFRTPIGRSRREYRASGRTLPTQAAVGLGLDYRHRTTRRDTLGSRIEGQLVEYPDDARFLAVDARAVWTRRLGERTDLLTDVGVFASRRLRNTDATAAMEPAASRYRLFPVGLIGVQGRLRSRSSHWIDGRVSIGADGFFDRLRGQVEPRARGQVELTTTIPPRWTTGVVGSVFAPLTGSARTLGSGVVSGDDVVFRAQTPIGYRVNNYTRFEFGTVFSVRATHFAAADFRFSRLEAWLYVAIRIGASTARGGSEFGGAASGPIGVGTTGLGAYSGGQ